jgi:WD40 repeat protein
MNHAHKLIIILFSTTLIVSAQGPVINWDKNLFGENAKDRSYWFLTLPVSAGAMGAGGISSQGSMDAADLPFFPANSGLFEKTSVSLTHYHWLMGMNKEYAGAVYPTIRFGTVGIFSEVFSTGSGPQLYTDDGLQSSISLREYAVGGTFGRAFFQEKLCLGLAASWVGSDRVNMQSGTGSLSADLLYAPLERFAMRAYVRNLSSGALPLQCGAALRVVAVQLPDLVNGPRNIVTLGAGFQKTALNPFLSAISAECNPLPALVLRTGYTLPSSDRGSGETGLSAGIGVRIRDLSLDGAWKSGPEKSGTIWAASAAFAFNDFVTRSPDDYVKLANSNYHRKRYGGSLDYSKKALQLDAGSWMAHNLFRKSTAALQREKSSELWILYSGNFRGNFIASNEDGSMGGLARAAAVIKGVHREIPFSISIATGNMLTRESLPVLEKVTREYYDYMVDDDARCLGRGELEYGADRLLADPTSKPMLCLTAPGSGNGKIVSSMIITRQGYRFAVISGVADTALLKQKDSTLPARLRRALDDSVVARCNLRIAVIHDTWENIERYGPTLKNADIIVCADLKTGFIPVRKLGSSIVVASPGDGSSVGSLVVRIDSLKGVTAGENMWIPLDEDIAPDNQVAEWIATIMPKSPAQKTSGANGVHAGDLFAFLHEVDGVRTVYIKSSGSLIEATLAGNDTAIGSPAVSTVAGKVAFMHTSRKSGCAPLTVYSLSKNASTTIVDDKNVREALFSPNGKWIYYAASDCDDTATVMYRVRSDGGVTYPVIAWKNCIEKELTFSPKSPAFVFCSNRDGSWQVYLTDLEGSHPLRLTDDEDSHRKPLFSPDGRYIAYLSNHLNAGNGVDLWIYDRTSGRQVRITEKMNIDDYCWLDNSRKVLISEGLDFPELKVLDISTGTASKFLRPDPRSAEAPYGQKNPRLIRFNGKKKVLYDRDYGEGEKVLYWTAVDGSDEQALVDKE